ncbi:MAG: hypothetical protein IJK87_13145 [Prevotella sp.]|nr:hypothetical protein [Prevotella sp.]
MITISDTKSTLPTIQKDNYKAFFHQEQMKFLSGTTWQNTVGAFWKEMRLNVSPNDVEVLVSFLRNKRDAILQAYRQEEFFVFWNRCFDSAIKLFDEEKFIHLLCLAYSNHIERSDLDAFFAWYCLTGFIDELLSRILEHQSSLAGATINFFYNDGGEIHFGTPSGKKAENTTAEEDPLRNIIFSERLFDSNARLAKLRDTIASAIDMGDATIMYGKPQAMRIDPTVKSEWYYIVKSIEEAKVAHDKLSVTGFIEQMMEWYPMLFPDGTKEEWEKFKRRLSKSISDEKSLWRQGKMKEVVSLREMWAKGISKKIGSAKANRIYEIAYKGLFRNLENLKGEIEREKTEQ